MPRRMARRAAQRRRRPEKSQYKRQRRQGWGTSRSHPTQFGKIAPRFIWQIQFQGQRSAVRKGATRIIMKELWSPKAILLSHQRAKDTERTEGVGCQLYRRPRARGSRTANPRIPCYHSEGAVTRQRQEFRWRTRVRLSGGRAGRGGRRPEDRRGRRTPRRSMGSHAIIAMRRGMEHLRAYYRFDKCTEF